MWKKEIMTEPTAAQQRVEPMASSREEPMSPPRRDPIAPPDRAATPRAAVARATIGRSITIRGEVSGDEDLLIEGRVDGTVNLKQHAVTVGADGEVKANVSGRVVTVEGRVEGNLAAEEQVILRSSAQVEGDIAAPRLVLEDGARFRGGVDMGETAGWTGRTAGAGPTRKLTVPETGRPADASGQSEGTEEKSSDASGSRAGAVHTGAR